MSADDKKPSPSSPTGATPATATPAAAATPKPRDLAAEQAALAAMEAELLGEDAPPAKKSDAPKPPPNYCSWPGQNLMIS